MLKMIILKLLFNFFKSRTLLQLEIVFLRKQLEILNWASKRIQIKNRDRFFLVFMKRIFSN